VKDSAVKVKPSRRTSFHLAVSLHSAEDKLPGTALHGNTESNSSTGSICPLGGSGPGYDLLLFDDINQFHSMNLTLPSPARCFEVDRHDKNPEKLHGNALVKATGADPRLNTPALAIFNLSIDISPTCTASNPDWQPNTLNFIVCKTVRIHSNPNAKHQPPMTRSRGMPFQLGYLSHASPLLCLPTSTTTTHHRPKTRRPELSESTRPPDPPSIWAQRNPGYCYPRIPCRDPHCPCWFRPSCL
jgi:hypothetical protein